MIVHFLIDAMRGRIDGAKTSHRIDAARLLLKLGSDDAPAFIAGFSSHSRPGGGSAYSSGAIVGRHNRKYVTRLAKFVRTKTGDGKDLVNFLVDAMLGRPEDFKPAARLAAAKELLRLGWETVPTVGRNRKARRSEAAANGLLVDSRKAAPDGPKANGAKTAPRPTAPRPVAPKPPTTAPRPVAAKPLPTAPRPVAAKPPPTARKISQETGRTARRYGSTSRQQPRPPPTTAPPPPPKTPTSRSPTGTTTHGRATPPNTTTPPNRATTPNTTTRKRPGTSAQHPPSSPWKITTPAGRRNRTPDPNSPTSAKPCAKASTSGATPPNTGSQPTRTQPPTGPPNAWTPPTSPGAHSPPPLDFVTLRALRGW